MTSKKLWVFILALVAFAVFAIANVSAMYGSIKSLEVKDVDALETSILVTVSPGESVPVRIEFLATGNAEDVRVKAWISGGSEFAAVTERFDVIANKTYNKVLSVTVPRTLDEEDLDEEIELIVLVENQNIGEADKETVKLNLQRESYVVEVLDADMTNEVSAGEVLPIDVVIKNRGRHFAEDTFVIARISALQIEDRAYFGDLSPRDQSNPDKEDSVERRLFLRIPSNAQPGIYNVEIESFNDDSTASVIKKVAIKGVETITTVVAPVHSKSFKAGETAEYNLVLVNAGNRVRVYELVIETPNGLDLDVSEPVVAVPAGTSKLVTFKAKAEKLGTYNFVVNVHSGAELVSKESFTAKVEENGGITAAGPSPTVLLTVVLAIVFVVLLIVLIVLLTRKPEKTEETGEGYY